MAQSDALSRRPDLCPAEDNDNDDRVLLPNQLFIQTLDLDLHDLIATTGREDTLIKFTTNALANQDHMPLNFRPSDWRITDDLLFYKDRCYVPDNLDLRRQITSRYHDTLPVGHPGQLRTQELVRQHYWWPGLSTFVRNYVNGCGICQQHKINRHPTNPPLQPIKALDTRPFSLITMDFITDLPISDGYDSIMVIVDHGSTKGVILEPCHKTIDALGTANILLNSLYKRYGLTDKAISDRGPQFASRTFKELGRLLGIKLAMSTAHHPQTDGATERANQEIEAYLSIFCGNNPETWKSHLPILEFSYNMKPHATQKEAPLFLQMGYNPISIPTAYPVTNIPATQE